MAGPVNVVFFHIDVTGSEEPVRPLHIGAVDSWGESEFEAYVWPEMGIQPGASHLYTEDGELYRYIFFWKLNCSYLWSMVTGSFEMSLCPALTWKTPFWPSWTGLGR